jgi:hypothetical protein
MIERIDKAKCLNCKNFDNYIKYKVETLNSIELKALIENNSSTSYNLIKAVEQINLRPSKPIYIFWHCYLVKKWQEIFNRQMKKIIDSQLYMESVKIFISAVGEECQLQELKKITAPFCKIEIVNAVNYNTHEFVCLHLLKQFCLGNDCYILYLHLKGVTKDWTAVWSWAEYMEYFCIERWKECVKPLEFGYDCSGVEWVTCNKRKEIRYNFYETYDFYYAGNFYFVSSDYIKKLPDFQDPYAQRRTGSRDRYQCEKWLGKQKPSFFCFKYSMVNLYNDVYDRSCYIVK